MFAICVESSHKKGMGHFFKMLNLAEYFSAKNEDYIMLINEDEIANRILEEKKVPFCIVNLNDFSTNWETEVIRKYRVDFWLNDRLDTSSSHAQNVRENGICLATIDDLGTGAGLSDIHFAAMPCIFNHNPSGKKIYIGIEYMILNKEIDKYKRLRNKHSKILVTLGGSDTYGVTIKIVNILRELSNTADIIVGPSFKHKRELLEIVSDRFNIKSHVPSLISEFGNYDIAITGGGITPFEANASGLPCIIIANELHEIENAVFLDKLGSSVFAGFHDNINQYLFERELDIAKMSEIGLKSVQTSAIENIYSIIKDVS